MESDQFYVDVVFVDAHQQQQSGTVRQSESPPCPHIIVLLNEGTCADQSNGICSNVDVIADHQSGYWSSSLSPLAKLIGRMEIN